MFIERTIHQMWLQGRENIPQHYRPWMEEWRARNPGYDYRFWDEDAVGGLLDAHYPSFSDPWRRLSLPIKQSDAARYFVLHHFGGVYADLDTEAVRGIDELVEDLNLSDARVVLSAESHTPMVWKGEVALQLARERRIDPVVGNAVILSQSRVDFWLDFLAASFHRADLPVLESFGTWHLSEFLQRHPARSEVRVLPAVHLLDPELAGEATYVRHAYDATWFDDDLPRPWGVR